MKTPCPWCGVGTLYPHGPTTTTLYACDNCCHQCSPETAVALASLQIAEDHDIVLTPTIVRDHIPSLETAEA